MLANLRDRLTYANVIATLALLLALGGTSYAALRIKKLTGRDVTNNSLTGADVKNLESGDVTDGSLLAADFKVGQLPAGVRGAQGPKGDKGDQGDQGQTGAAGMARAYALGGGSSCQGTPPPFVTCPVVRGKGVDYIVKVATGKYCVGVSGINAAASDSVAVVTVSGPGGGFDNHLFAARWSRNNVACVSTEFEVETQQIIQTSARNTTDTGAVQVSSAPVLSDLPQFTIAIL